MQAFEKEIAGTPTDDDLLIDEELLVIERHATPSEQNQNKQNEEEEEEELRQSMICPLCYGLLRVPVLACNGCGFHACGTCLRRWERESRRCPLKCDKHVLFEECQLRQIVKEIKIVRVRCPFSRRTEAETQQNHQPCQVLLPYEELQEHIKTCQFRIVPCIYTGCTQVFTRSAQKIHENLCEFWEGKCKFCLQKFRRNKWHEHEKQCDKQTVDCMHKKRGCKIRPQLTNFDKHISTQCLYRNENCTYCARIVPFCKMKEHLAVACEALPETCTACLGSFTRRKLSDHVRECAHLCILCKVCNLEYARNVFANHPCNESQNTSETGLNTQNAMKDESEENEIKYD